MTLVKFRISRVGHLISVDHLQKHERPLTKTSDYVSLNKCQSNFLEGKLLSKPVKLYVSGHFSMLL